MSGNRNRTLGVIQKFSNLLLGRFSWFIVFFRFFFIESFCFITVIYFGSDNNYWFVFIFELVIDQIVFSGVVNTSDPFDSCAIFPLAVSSYTVFVCEVTITVFFFVLPASIVNSSIAPSFNSKTVLLVIMKVPNVLVSVIINADSMTLSFSHHPVSGICIFILSYLSSLAMLHPFTNFFLVLLLPGWSLFFSFT